MTSTGAGQPWTTSRGTLNTKSAFVTYIRVRNVSIMSIVRSGRCLSSAGPQVCMLLSYMGFDSLRRCVAQVLASWAAPPEPLGHHADRALLRLRGIEDHVLAEATADDLDADRLGVVLIRWHNGRGQAHEVHGIAVERAAEHLAHALGALLVTVPGEDRRRKERGDDQRIVGHERGPGANEPIAVGHRLQEVEALERLEVPGVLVEDRDDGLRAVLAPLDL